MQMGKKHSKLTAIERENIAIWLSQEISMREIARRLERSDSTIRNELKRNSFGEHYVAVHAQAKSKQRVDKARKRHPLKNSSVYGYVLKKLRCGWSPEQISGRLKLKKPDNPYWHIHYETIYRFIYAKENKEKAKKEKKKVWQKSSKSQNTR
jgi:IS30 family transposase